jgi:hypothetical protein
MKGKIISLRIRTIVYIVLLAIAVGLTYLLLPKNDDFDRYFEVGKPWTYEELIAPKDFAIYKSENQLQSERAEAMTKLEPYVSISKKDDIIVNNIVVENRRLRDWVTERLDEVFQVGVISLADKQEMDKIGVSRVVLLEGNRIGRKASVGELFTPKSAYDYILSKAQGFDWIDINQLRASNIDQYILPNAQIDQVKTDQAKQVIINGVMRTSGMVQKGEKILTVERLSLKKNIKSSLRSNELWMAKSCKV